MEDQVIDGDPLAMELLVVIVQVWESVVLQRLPTTRVESRFALVPIWATDHTSEILFWTMACSTRERASCLDYTMFLCVSPCHHDFPSFRGGFGSRWGVTPSLRLSIVTIYKYTRGYVYKYGSHCICMLSRINLSLFRPLCCSLIRFGPRPIPTGIYRYCCHAIIAICFVLDVPWCVIACLCTCIYGVHINKIYIYNMRFINIHIYIYKLIHRHISAALFCCDNYTCCRITISRRRHFPTEARLPFWVERHGRHATAVWWFCRWILGCQPF